VAHNACNRKFIGLKLKFTDLLYFLGLLFLLPWMLLRALGNKPSFYLMKRAICEDIDSEIFFWIHGASVGELNAATYLIEKIENDYPDKKILISSFSTSGYSYAKQKFKNHKTILLPLDFSFITRKYIEKIQPKAVMIIEPDLWPNLIRILNQENIPIFLLNARSPNISIKNKFQSLLYGEMINKFEYIFTQDEVERNKFLKFKQNENFVITTGNMKFDFPDQEVLISQEVLDLKLRASKNKKIICCGSFHAGEEYLLINALKNIDAFFILVPRYPKESEIILKNLEANNINASLMSRNETLSDVKVFIYDKMGDLISLYGISDIAVVGGSFLYRGVGREGHNLMEPANLSKPVIFGPYLGMFEQFAIQLIHQRGGFKVSSAEEFYDALSNLIIDDQLLELTGKNAQKLIETNRGATQNNLSYIMNAL